MLSNPCLKQAPREHAVVLHNVLCKLSIPPLYHESICTIYSLLQGCSSNRISDYELLQRYYGHTFFPVELYHDYKVVFDLLMSYGMPASKYEDIIYNVGKFVCTCEAVDAICMFMRNNLDSVDTYLRSVFPDKYAQCKCTKEYLECCSKMSFSKCFDALYKFFSTSTELDDLIGFNPDNPLYNSVNAVEECVRLAIKRLPESVQSVATSYSDLVRMACKLVEDMSGEKLL